MDLNSLRHRLAHLAAHASDTRDAPLVAARAAVAGADAVFAAAKVLAALETWAAQRPDYQAEPEPTVPHQPDDLDRHMAATYPELSELAQPHLTHGPGILEGRLAALYARYQAAGEHDAAVDAALDEVPVPEAPVPQFAAPWLAALRGRL